MLYGLKVSDFKIRKESETLVSLKYTLSEGDKNALAFSFFLADVEQLSNNLGELIIVIDDPITSFDYARKATTTNLINRLSLKINKLIILSHDLNFVNELSRKMNYKCLNLKIIFNGVSSVIIPHDIKTESLTGIFKDLNILNEFIKNGANSEPELREVVRCIRPVLEGILRIKYYGLIGSNEWLGDIISKIKNSNTNDPFYNSYNQLEDLAEINDYSKEYHHSNPYYYDAPINAEELKIYVNRTIKILREI